MANEPAWLKQSTPDVAPIPGEPSEEGEVPAWLTDGQRPPMAEAVPVAAPVSTPIRGPSPSWTNTATSQDAIRVAAQQAAVGVAQAEAARSAAEAKKDLGEMPKAWLIMRILNPIVAVFIIACVSTKLDGLVKVDAWVICLYLIVFALLLCCFELCGSFHIIAAILAENFGFLYNVAGRLIFLIFSGVLVLSLNTKFAYFVCALTLAAAVYNAVILAIYPDWTKAMVLKHQEAATSRYRRT